MVTETTFGSLSIVIAAAALALVFMVPQAEPPKWGDVLGYIHRDIRTEKGVHEEWELSGQSKTGEVSGMKIKRWMDGPRFRQEISFESNLVMAGASDGARYWLAFPGAGCYLWDVAPQNPTKEEWKGTPKSDPDEYSVNVTVANGYDLIIRLNPEPVVTKVEEVDGERRVHATMKGKERQMNLILRFEKEKWVLKDLSGKSAEGETMLSFKRTQSLRGQTFESNLFALDDKIVKDLRELTGEEREEFIKATKGGG